MKKETINRIVFFLSLFPLFVFSQDDDHQTWSSIGLKYGYTQKVDFSFEGGFRFIDNSTLLSKYFFDVSMKRKCSDVFSYVVGFRPIAKKNNDLVFERSNRFYGDVRFKKKINSQIDFSLRTRVQTQIEDRFGFAENVKNKIRKKVKLAYDVQDFNLDVFLSLEIFYLFGDSFEKVRYVMGLEKVLTKNLNININYLIQNKFNIDSRELVFVLRTHLRYSF